MVFRMCAPSACVCGGRATAVTGSAEAPGDIYACWPELSRRLRTIIAAPLSALLLPLSYPYPSPALFDSLPRLLPSLHPARMGS
jgi:hypothetical protein